MNRVPARAAAVLAAIAAIASPRLTVLAAPVKYEGWLEDAVQVAGPISLAADNEQQAPVFYRLTLGPKPPDTALSTLGMALAVSGAEADLRQLLAHFTLYSGLYTDTDSISPTGIASGPMVLGGQRGSSYYGTVVGIEPGDYTLSISALCTGTCTRNAVTYEATMFGPLAGPPINVPEPGTLLLALAAVLPLGAFGAMRRS